MTAARGSLRCILGGVVIAALVAACGPATGPSAPDPSASPTAGALTGLPPCAAAPTPAPDAGELPPLPPGAIVTDVRSVPPITDVRGYVPMTPLEVQLYYQGLDDVTLVQAENEIFEAEVLLTDGGQRTYVKALAVCDQGSTLLVVIAPADDSAGVPQPSGSPTG